MRKYKAHVLLTLLAALLAYAACRKLDHVQEKAATPSDAESRFFTAHASANPFIQSLMNMVKSENDKYGFVDRLVSQIGYPYWDKSRIVSRSSIQPGGRGNSADTVNITYIPFARDSQNAVDASLLIKTTPSDTSIQFLLDWQYSSYGFDTTAEGWNARDVFHVFSKFDNIVFGRESFRITDWRLFRNTSYGDSDQLILKLRNTANAPGSSILITYNECDIYDDCFTTAPLYNQLCGGICAEGDCPFWYGYHYECTTYWVEDGWVPVGGGSGNGGGSGGSGGGSGGGGWTPPQCPTAARTARFDDCVPGWVPPEDTQPPIDPCAKVASLKTDSLFKVDAADLRALAPGDREYAYTYKSTGARAGYYTGVPGQCEVRIPVDTSMPKLKIYLHLHNDDCPLPIFSPEDFRMLYDLYTLGKTDSVFAFGVVTDSEVYLMVIDDVSALASFYNKYFSEGGIYDPDKLTRNYNAYDINRSNSAEVNEKKFLQFLKAEGVGVKLLKANSDLSGYNTLSLNRDNNLVSMPCPQ